jgi:mannose-6-phosphate isomerase-like protein (cupin superfamily)
MIRVFDISKLDLKCLSEANVNDDTELEEFDFSKVIVRKPWGHEYLAYREDGVSIWILRINREGSTSMHCHPNKRTDLAVLSGKVICSTLDKKVELSEGDLIILNKKVFHSTRAISDNVIVMEIEFPSIKTDLVRLNDSYGREKKGYENKKEMCFDLSEYQRVFFKGNDQNRIIGNMNINIEEFKDANELKKYIQRNNNLLNIFLSGEINSDDNNPSLGDSITYDNIKDKDIKLSVPVKIITIKKNLLDFD